MYWENPSVLLGLWILPLVAALMVYAHRRRASAARQFADPAMVRRLMPSVRGGRPWVKGACILLALGCLIVAGARPRFGVYFEKVAQRGVDLFVLLDVSRSMTAEDVAPNRLERAKSDIRDLLKKLPGDRVGLIVFAGKPVVKVPLTTDQGFFRAVLDEINTRSAPRGGSLIGDAIRKAMEAMPERRNRDQVMVLITDGEDHDSFPREAAKQAAERGIKIFTVGLGDSKEGARVPIRDRSGKMHYLKYKDQEVWSKVDEDLLKQIALSSKGAYIPAGTRAYDLGQIYEDHLAGLAQGELNVEKRKRHRDQFQLFLCIGIVLLLVEMAIPTHHGPTKLKNKNRSTNHNNSRGTTSPGSPPAAVSRRLLRHRPVKPTTIILLLALLGLPTAAPAASPNAADQVKLGIEQFEAGDYAAASEAFARADATQPDDRRIAFDRACAYAAAGDEARAIEWFQKAALTEDHKLAARCHYNMGCLAVDKARALLGEKPEEATPETRTECLELMELAIAHFRDATGFDENGADARHNLEAARLWIRHIKEVWRQRDLQKQREKMNLLEYLQMLEQRQRTLRTTGKALAGEHRSPKRRQAVFTAETSERRLAEEIEPLKAKIHAGLRPQQSPQVAASGGTPQPAVAGQPNAEKAAEVLGGLADNAGKAMLAAADELRHNRPAAAVPVQADVVEKLDQVYMVVAPYTNLVQRAVERQKGLVDQYQQEPIDLNESAWNQRFITGWSEMLLAKAKQGLKNMPPAEPAPAPKLPVAGPPVAESSKDDSPKKTDPAEAARKQLEALRKAMEKAVELAPKVKTLTAEAATHLEQQEPAEALPKQEEALKLLKEMLPKQDQQKNQDKKDQQKKDQDKKDQEKKDQNKKDQDKKDQDKKDQEKKNQDKKDQEKKDRNKKDQDKKNDKEKEQSGQRPQQPRDLSKKQADAVLRKARERQQKRRKLEALLQQQLYRPGKVEKDW